MKRPKLNQVLALTVALTAGIASQGCSSESGGAGRLPEAGSSQTGPVEGRQYGIRAFFETPNGERHPLTILPADAYEGASAGGASGSGDTGEPRELGAANTPDVEMQSATRSKSQTVVIEEDSKPQIDSIEQDVLTGLAPGWTLALLAARACAKGGNASGIGRPAVMIDGSFFTTDGHNNGGFFFFNDRQHEGVASCDGILRAQEIMMCTADKLVEVADSIGTVTWDVDYVGTGAPATGGDPAGIETARLIIPPQRTRDRFVARDMAMNVLGQLAASEWYIPGNDKPKLLPHHATCTDAYLDSAVNGFVPVTGFGPNGDGSIYDNAGWPTNLQPFVAGNSWHEIGQARLDMRANILSGAARMMRKLIVDTVRDDLATAEAVKAQTADPLEGRKRFWGYSSTEEVLPGGQHYYGSVNHALWKLNGRLEIGTAWYGNDDPIVWDVSAVRFRDRPWCWDGYVKLPGEEGLGPGFWLTSSDLAHVQPPQTTGQALAAHLVEASGIADRDGVLAEVGSETGLRAIMAEVLGAQFAAADDTEPSHSVAASLASSANIIAMLDTVSEADLAFGMRRAGKLLKLYGMLGVTEVETTDAGFSTAASQKGLIQVAGGLPVDEISNHNAMTNLMFEARLMAQCHARAPTDADPNIGPAFAMQGVFPFAQSVARRLDYIQPGLSSDGQQAAEIAQSEIGEWAGTGLIVARSSPPRVEIYGLDAADFGLTDQGFLDLLDVTTSELGAADCLTGQRTHCTGVETKTAPVVTRSTLSQTVGGKPVYRLVLNSWAPWSKQLLVLRASDGILGAILGSIPQVADLAQQADPIAVDVLSPLRNDLIDRIFSGRPIGQVEGTCATQGSVGLPEQYCLEGMERDMYVPLSNALNSTSEGGTEDSWRHYLAQAKEAAAYADELGQELLAQGVVNTIEKEQAAEEFAELCGVFPTEDDVVVENGVARVLPGNEAVSGCVDPEKYDIVFLRQNPFETVQGAVDALCDVADYDFCTPLIGAGPITVAELGLETSSPVPFVQEPSACQEIIDAANVLFTGVPRSINSTEYHQIINQPYASLNSILYTLNMLELQTWENGHWALLAGGQPLMGTQLVSGLSQTVHIPDIYPACLDHADGCSEFAQMMRSAFSSSSFPNSMDKEARMMLERAIFHLGALGGRVPDGTISIPLPAEIVDEESTDEVAIPALYGHGRFVPVGNVYKYDGTDEERREMADWLPPTDPALFRGRWSPAGSGAPWRDATMQNLGNFLVQHRFNHEVLFVDRHGLEGQPRALIQEAMHNWISDYDSSCGYGGLTRSLHAVSGSPALGGEIWEDEEFIGSDPVERHVCTRSMPYAAGFHTFTNIDQNLHGLDSDVDQMGTASGLFATHTVMRDFDDGFFEPIEYTSAPHFPDIISFSPYPYFRWKDVIQVDAFETGNSWSLKQNGLDMWYDSNTQQDQVTIVRERFSPKDCPPGERVEMFLHKEVVDDCDALDALAQALMLSCTAGSYRPSLESAYVPPEVHTPNDMYLLEAWMRRSADAIHYIAGAQFLVDVPKQAVDVALGRGLDHDAVTMGDRGTAILDLEQAMRDMESGFSGISSAFNRLSLNIQDARHGLEAVKYEEQANILGLLNQQMNVERELAILDATESYTAMKWAANFVTRTHAAAATGNAAGKAFAGPNPIAQAISGAVGTAVNTAAATVEWYAEMMIDLETRRINGEAFSRMSDNYDQQIAVAGELADIAEARQLIDVNLDTHFAREDMRLSVESIYRSANTALQSLNALNQVEMNARRALAKLAGADFVQTEQGRLPVELSTVYRRMYDLKTLRYQRALEAAKRAAYLARLAIEQRLGVRMRDLQEPLGPVEAPSVWVDDVCSLNGVDYEALATAAGWGESEVEILGSFADQYIGDYVEQLEEFVEYYNLEYPFGESPDRAVVSLRDHSQAANQTCAELNPNLLTYSNDLGATGPSRDQNTTGVWRATDCGPSSCIGVTSFGGAEVGGEVLLSPSGRERYSLLAEVPSSQTTTLSNGPDGWFYQNVTLEAGTDYALSYWDAAISDAADSEVSYQVAVFDSNWSPVAIQFPTVVSTASTDDAWGERVVINFIAPTAGIYRVGIGEVDPDADTQLAVANFQVEAGDSGPYRENDATRTVVATYCQGSSPEGFRDGFDYVCEGSSCYYRSKFPFYLDEEFIAAGSGVLPGGIGAGNYNYRLQGVALNVVGSGVLDCSESSTSCYADGFIGYDLQHHTGSVALTSPATGVTCFDFRTGAIRGGKALATERVLSLPLSSADASLVLEPGTYKSELSGRPMSGSYTLRIWDQPELRWENVEDIQLLVDYRYWSAVE